jgi:hypothetical protein
MDKKGFKMRYVVPLLSLNLILFHLYFFDKNKTWNTVEIN